MFEKEEKELLVKALDLMTANIASILPRIEGVDRTANKDVLRKTMDLSVKVESLIITEPETDEDGRIQTRPTFERPR